MSRSQKTGRKLLRAVLLSLTAATLCATCGLYARYSADADFSARGRAARFVVEAAPAYGQTEELGELKKDQLRAYRFTVSNEKDGLVSETSADYAVTVTLPQRVEGVTLTLQNGESSVPPAVSEDGTVYTFQGAGHFAAGAARTDTLTLTFAVGAGAKNAELRNIRIAVDAAQQD